MTLEPLACNNSKKLEEGIIFRSISLERALTQVLLAPSDTETPQMGGTFSYHLQSKQQFQGN